MRDDDKVGNLGQAPATYDFQFFFKSFRAIEIFLDRIVERGPIRVSSIDADSLTVSGTIAVSGNATFGGNVAVTGDITVDDITADDITAQDIVTQTLAVDVTDNGATFLPSVKIRRRRAAPSGNEPLGEILFQGLDSALNVDDFAYISARSFSPTSGSEQGRLYLGNRHNGTYYDSILSYGQGAIYLPQGGLEFPAAAVSWSGANQLDDYEEGTWTPTYIALSGTFGVITYSSIRFGNYTKIGNRVIFSCRIATDSFAVGTGITQILVDGLPFTVGQYSTAALGYTLVGGGTAPRAALVASGTTRIYLYQNAGANDQANVSTNYPPSGFGVGASASSNWIDLAGSYSV